MVALMVNPGELIAEVNVFQKKNRCVVKSNDSIYENVSKRERFAVRCYAVMWCDVIHFAHKFCNCIETEFSVCST